ncbi:MAG TPA: PIN domain-containing protein [Thermoflexales bacterium]|nr:PIN domain-containing protein [Thermoflexales bacterium]HRA54996.1 PIN domain-containing protein [Thermoflexales bacterium]
MRFITIDSSVFVSSARPMEPGHEHSSRFLAWVKQARPRIYLPTLVLVEIAAALSRTGSEASLAQRFAGSIAQLPNVVMVGLDEGLARQAALLGAEYKLRGADAVYVATAAQFGAELITLDEEQSQRGAKVVAACNPGVFEYSP